MTDGVPPLSIPSDRLAKFFAPQQEDEKVLTLQVEAKTRLCRFKTSNLSFDEKWQVLVMLAANNSHQSIADWLLAEHKKKITRHAVAYYAARYRPLVDRLFEEIAKSYTEHPMANKMQRLDLILEAAEDGRRVRPRQMCIDKDGRKHYFETKDYGQVLSAVREARFEVEGDPRGGHNIKVDHGDGEVKISIIEVMKEFAQKFKAQQAQISGVMESC